MKPLDGEKPLHTPLCQLILIQQMDMDQGKNCPHFASGSPATRTVPLEVLPMPKGEASLAHWMVVVEKLTCLIQNHAVSFVVYQKIRKILLLLRNSTQGEH